MTAPRKAIGGAIVFRDDGSGRVDFRIGFRRGECFVAGAAAPEGDGVAILPKSDR